MAITKRFTQLHAALVTSDAPAKALEAGILAVCAAYSNQDPEMALALCNDTPQFMRVKFASWLRSYGVAIADPERGSSTYTIQPCIVKDSKRQAKVFAEVKGQDVRPVLVEEIQTRKVLKAKELKGLAKDRAQKKMEAVIKAVKKDDPDAACIINDAWVSASKETNEVFFDLTAEEEKYLIEELMALRLAKSLRKAA